MTNQLSFSSDKHDYIEKGLSISRVCSIRCFYTFVIIMWCPQTQALVSSCGCGEFKKASQYCQLSRRCGLRHKHTEERLAAFFLLQTQSGSLYNPTTCNHGQTVIHDLATELSIRCCKVVPCWFMQGDCRVKPFFLMQLSAVKFSLVEPSFLTLLHTNRNMFFFFKLTNLQRPGCKKKNKKNKKTPCTSDGKWSYSGSFQFQLNPFSTPYEIFPGQ